MRRALQLPTRRGLLLSPLLRVGGWWRALLLRRALRLRRVLLPEESAELARVVRCRRQSVAG
jgi:hypothetical protein